MNIFAIVGDLLHLASIFILFVKIFATRSVRGISYKTQLLYAIIFITRYVDLLHFFHDLLFMQEMPSLTQWYLSFMKILYISLSVFLVYIMRFVSPWKQTCDKNVDSFRIEFIVIPSVVMSLIWNEEFTIFEVLYTFSLWLEAFAIVPQLYIIHNQAKISGGFVENLTSHYVFTLGGYRVLYAFNWIYKAFTMMNYWHPIVWLTGVIQTLIYCDFFYYYITCTVKGDPVLLPV